MRLFFDSSVLVAVFYADHVHHTPSTKLFLGAGKGDFCALRTLGEVYVTLTRLPVRPRITGANGAAIVKQIRDRLSLTSLTEQEYVSALDSAASQSIIGGALYDLLIAQCALKAKVDVLLTWNVRDFVRLGPHIQRLVRTPLEM